MRRREFIAGLAGAATLPLAVRAQQRVPRIGVLLVSGSEILGEFPQGLRELGYVEGKNILVETLSASGNTGRLAGLAEELVRGKVDIIVAAQVPSVIAAKAATARHSDHHGARCRAGSTRICREPRAAGRQHHRCGDARG
jgi:putative ABC transport system substrate-binding protein